ncbi:hypothetical protein BEP19_02180 [Ammoniphilus oxalaticus]|uniref:Uncharacterized protein n=1 Tax=Ammoniphilus oxalaticus TaxID=66863 RepID=A0A419SNH2_9BACL|nr:hypothetical protein [Ammoniphilus oxalaticus]RKD25771.1 hypothetical protein BEP19_02180 [Ammoniphilus oxalaticus]
MERERYIRQKWGTEPLIEIADALQIELAELLELAFVYELYEQETPSLRRRWDPQEEAFLQKYSDRLSIKEASHLLYRSHYATYQRVRYLGLDEMVKRK